MILVKEGKNLWRHINDKHPEEKGNELVMAATRGFKRPCKFCKVPFADLNKHTKKCKAKKEENIQKEKEKIENGLLSNKEFVELFHKRMSRNGGAQQDKTAKLYVSKLRTMIKVTLIPSDPGRYTFFKSLVIKDHMVIV